MNTLLHLKDCIVAFFLGKKYDIYFNIGEQMRYRYVVHFNIADENVSKFFNEEEHANKFAKMVNGKVTKFGELNYGKDEK